MGLFSLDTSWRKRTRLLQKTFVDVIFPPVCANCGRVGELFCETCYAAVHWISEPVCGRCGRRQNVSLSECERCAAHPMPLEWVRAAVWHTDPVRRVLHEMKYEGYFALARPLASIMVNAWGNIDWAVDLVVPIPLHMERFRKRGYNQSELLVREAKRFLDWETAPGALKRTRYTRPQVGLNPEERRENVNGAFSAESDQIKDKNLLLVDDVFTTGSTLSAAAETLLRAGAHSVAGYCLTMAAEKDYHQA